MHSCEKMCKIMHHENARQILNFIPIMLLGMNSGVGMIWASPMLYRLQSEHFPLTMSDISLIGSAVYYGTIFGPLLAYLLTQRIGPKLVIVLCSLAFTSQWTLLSFYKNVPVLLVCQLIFGMFFSLYQTILPIYVVENSSPEIRGSLLAAAYLGVGTGSLLSNLILYVDYFVVHLILAGIAFITTISTLYICESVEYLLKLNRFSEAKRTFFWLRSVYSEKEELYFEQLVQKSIEATFYQAHSIWDWFRMNNVRRALKINTTIVVLIVCCGYGPLASYCTLLISPEIDQGTVTWMTLAKGFVYWSGSVISPFVIEKFPRRVFFKLGFSCQLLILSTMGVLYYTAQYHPYNNLTYYIYTCLTVLDLVYGIFYFPILSCLMGEILPQHVKSLGTALIVTTSSIGSAMVTSLFWPLAELAGLATNLFIFSGFTAAVLIYGHFYLPETKGKSLLEMEHLFDDDEV